MSILPANSDNAADNAIRLGGDAAQRERMRQAQSQYIPDNAADRIIDAILHDFPAAVSADAATPVEPPVTEPLPA